MSGNLCIDDQIYICMVCLFCVVEKPKLIMSSNILMRSREYMQSSRMTPVSFSAISHLSGKVY